MLLVIVRAPKKKCSRFYLVPTLLRKWTSYNINVTYIAPNPLWSSQDACRNNWKLNSSVFKWYRVNGYRLCLKIWQTFTSYGIVAAVGCKYPPAERTISPELTSQCLRSVYQGHHHGDWWSSRTERNVVPLLRLFEYCTCPGLLINPKIIGSNNVRSFLFSVEKIGMVLKPRKMWLCVKLFIVNYDFIIYS